MTIVISVTDVRLFCIRENTSSEIIVFVSARQNINIDIDRRINRRTNGLFRTVIRLQNILSRFIFCSNKNDKQRN